MLLLGRYDAALVQCAQASCDVIEFLIRDGPENMASALRIRTQIGGVVGSYNLEELEAAMGR